MSTLKKITVDAAFYDVGSGNVGLSAEQAKARLHNLKPVKIGKDGAGEYEVVHPIQFKRGESFGYSGQVGKNGRLSDGDAEELRQLERAETIEKAVAQARSSAFREARKESEDRIRELSEQLTDAGEEIAKLRAELEQARAGAIA